MKNILINSMKMILDVLFPIKCISCQKEGQWLCEFCQSKVKTQDEHVCGVCEKMITPSGLTCLACKNLAYRQAGKSSLDALIPACSYKQPAVVKMVHLFKYRFISDLHLPLGNLLVNSLRKTDLPLPQIIVPIPLHSRRLRWRGFNQSELLAKHLAENLLPNSQLEMSTDILTRSRYTSPQMGIKNYASRQKNIAGAFSISPDLDLKNKTVLLVDDIATTGSTIFECAKILKSAGAQEVFAIVIARQETKANGR